MVFLGEPETTRSSKEGCTGPGRKRSRSKPPCRSVVGSRPWIVTAVQPEQYGRTQSFILFFKTRNVLLFVEKYSDIYRNTIFSFKGRNQAKIMRNYIFTITWCNIIICRSLENHIKYFWKLWNIPIIIHSLFHLCRGHYISYDSCNVRFQASLILNNFLK